ncbi:hypothetical protein JCM33374_g3467 [Metschnikowia sp. JCM 33374]|nr:hypothetical protein JCM33374_g3467 [Metschnikowia sp. JCM 33374]
MFSYISLRNSLCAQNKKYFSRTISQSLAKRKSNSNDELFLDSSINTMEQILTILRNAHGTKTETRETILDQYDSDLNAFRQRLLSFLGDDVFSLRTVDILIDLQLRNDIDIFKDSPSNHTKTVLQRYISAFRDQYSRDSLSFSMKDIGKSFKENAQKTNSLLNNKIRRTALNAMKDMPPGHKNSPLNFEFCQFNLYNPFRNGTADPFALRKGLSTKKHPTNLFSAMVNNEKVIRGFLSLIDKKSPTTPTVVQNIMTAQSFHGDLAFKVAVKWALVDTDPRSLLETPFEFYHLGTPDEMNKINQFKAIVASRSMLLKRLAWFYPYRKSLAMLEEKNFDSKEKIVAIMADIFDRFFGICYKLDAKYCEQWVQNLMDFYSHNIKNEAFLDRLLEESVAEFREVVSKSSFNTFGARWSQNLQYNKRSHLTDSKAEKQLVNEARALLQTQGV